LISVIIPTYNRPQFTARAVRSVLAQTWRDLEVIVVDDCSREPITRAALGDDSRVRILRHEANRGVGAARNTGIQAARGEVVALLDSDDYWLPEKLAGQMALYEQQADRDNVLVYSTYYYERDGKWVKEPFDSIRAGEPVSDYLFVRLGEILTSTWLASRALFAANPFYVELLRHQDGDLLLQFAAMGVRCVHCTAPGAVRCADLRPDRLSTKAVPAMRKLFLERNVERVTPRAAVLMEAGYEALLFPNEGYLKRQLRQLGFILRTGRLNVFQKVSLACCYIKTRVQVRLRERLVHQPPQGLEAALEAGGDIASPLNSGV
jgi:glycosyltransferase involved in cell wall biosynthesis